MARTILIVEDIRANREILKGILGSDYSYLEADNGLTAMQIVNRDYKFISAILLDLAMPVMDGFEVLKRMRSNAVLSQLPVIVMTSTAGAESEAKALAIGASDYITKPYNATIVRSRIHNIISLRETAATINSLQRDRLTGLYNREAFFDRVVQLVKAKVPGEYILSSLNIDGFKVINDQYGTEASDAVLRHIAHRINKFTSEVGGLCCRITADNFALLFPAEYSNSDVLDGYHADITSPGSISQALVVRIGRYLVNDLSLTPSAMYDRAVLAELSIKGKYGAYIAWYDESMRAEILREQEIVGEMKSALKGGQFEVWFQPQYNHSTGALIGAEALVRWRHPGKGLISPGIFIPIFEQNGFIYELDKYVWEQTCRCLRRWTDEGRRPLPVSVNISRYDIFRDDLVSVIAGLVIEYGIPADLLRLEITESAFAKSTSQIVSVVKELVSYGFTVEIDDFGSGYSSLNALKNVPAQVVKLDMRFLEGSDDSQRGGNILESMVRMTKWLGMSVIAEGVETVEQANFLKSIGCNYVQGYLYARPMPVSEYEAHCKGASKEERLLALEAVENLDNNLFWDPKSMDTLIFNSYVGGACIFEYYNGVEDMLRVNDKYAQEFGHGVTTEDIFTYKTADYMDDVNRNILRSNIQRAIDTNRESSCETVVRGLFGIDEPIYIHSTLRVIARAGERYLLYCTIINTTARREAEQQLRQTAEQLQAIMSNINGGVSAAVIVDSSARYLFVNDKYCEQLGYSKEQFEAETPQAFSLIHPDDRETVRQAAKHASAAREPYTCTYRIIRRDGAIRWLQSNVSITGFPGTDEPVQLAVANDITAQVEAEQKERRATEQAQAIMGDVGSGITAAVFDGDKIRFLFSNDKYYEILGYTRAQYNDEVSDIYGLIHPDDRERVKRAAVDAYRTHKPEQLEYRVARRDGTLRWVRVLLSSTRFTDVAQDVQLCIFTDVTAKKQYELKLHETDEQLHFLNDMAHDLLAHSDAEAGIDAALRKLMEYFGGNRAYIFEFDFEKRIARDTYEVCADGVRSEIDNLREVPVSMMEHWLSAFEKQGYYAINDMSELDDSRATEREALQAQDITSLFAAPLYRNKRLIGMIGVDDPRIRHAQLERLLALADYFAVMLTRRDLTAKIVSDNLSMQTLMDDTPGGFCRMRIYLDRPADVVYINDGYCRLVGMTREEAFATFGNNPLGGLHPDDYELVSAVSKPAAMSGGQFSAKCRLRHGKEGYIWVQLSGRFMKTDSGETYLNSYYSDISGQVGLEEEQRDLLDNLPYGAALYEYDGKELSVIHINKRYWKLVDRQPIDYGSAAFLDAVHPDDRPSIERCLTSAIRQGGDINCDLRILHGESGYRLFHIAGRALPKDGGKYAIYATYTPVSEEELSYQKMLPVALATMISSTSDIAFIKDKNLRYVCCSPSFAQMAKLDDARDIVGLTDYDIVNGEFADKYAVVDEEIIRTGVARLDYEETLPGAWNTVRYGLTSKYPLLDPAGMVTGIYGLTRDVTEYRSAYERLRLLTDSIQGGLASYICTRDGIRISYYNDTFARLMGYTREEFDALAAADPLVVVFPDDIPLIRERLDALLTNNVPIHCTFRIHTKSGELKWIDLRGTLSGRNGDSATVNAVFFDITGQMEINERLRLSEEEYRLAMRHSGNIICRYNTASRTLTMSAEIAAAYSMPAIIGNVPYGPVESGEIAPETANDYIAFYEGILAGKKEGVATFRRRLMNGWRWFYAHHSTLFSKIGEPVSAVISYADVTEQREKEAIYRKWQQSLQERKPDDYTLFRCNLSKNASFDTMEGALLHVEFDNSSLDFNDRTREYVEQCVYDDDKARYMAFMNSDTMLASYYRGKRSETIEYREKLPDGNTRWLRLSVDLVEYPDSTDIEAYLMYENIDDVKQAELQARTRAETDPLTGLLNRNAFSEKANRLLRERNPGLLYALMMFDLDGFKLVNDSFGHAFGDQVLTDVAARLRSLQRRDDLIGRLGGDEFLVFMCEAPDRALLGQKARLICDSIRKAFSVEVQLSASLGVAVCPDDGEDFDSLYRKADIALYHVKATGKNNYAFYDDSMSGEEPAENVTKELSDTSARRDEPKRRMLIVEDNHLNRDMLTHMFKDEFIIDTADDGSDALIRMRRYGTGISVVLLDLMMPGMDGFAVLEKMRSSPEMQSIPVVVVSGMNEREASLRTIRCGASDFVTKPVDPDLLRLRVHSAISKAENERLRAQNSYLALQSDDMARYRAVLESECTAIAEYDGANETFMYDPGFGHCIAGRFDGRPLWDILSMDADAARPDIDSLRQLVRDVAGDDARVSGSTFIALKTPAGDMRRFRVKVIQRVGANLPGEKLILAFTDTEQSN